jgi:hypothetical protein
MDFLLPFVLVFTLIFAILEKTQVLGENKKQINAIIGFVVGLMLIAFPFARDIVVKLMPFLAVSAVILLVFLLLYAFIAGKEKDVLSDAWKKAWITILAVALIGVLLYITGYWDLVWNFSFGGRGASQIWMNVLMIAAVIGVIIAVIKGDSGKSSG